MELLIPLLIFGAGLVFSGIKSANESKKQAQRKIDLSKLERPTGKAPLPKQHSQVEKESEKSLWRTLVDDFKEEYEKIEQEQKTRTEKTQEPKKRVESASKRLEQEIRSKVDHSRQGSDRKKSRREKETRTAQNIEPVQAVSSETKRVVKESASSQTNENKKVAFSEEDISFDEKAIVNGIIMNEILGPPKSKQRRRR